MGRGPPKMRQKHGLNDGSRGGSGDHVVGDGNGVAVAALVIM